MNIKSMKTPVYKIEVIVIDFEKDGVDEVKSLIENHRYLHAQCVSVAVKDAGEWEDSHPLNQRATDKIAIFNSMPEPKA